MPFSPWFKVTKLCKSLDDWNQKLDIVESTSLTVSWELSQHSRIILDTKKHTSSTQSAPPRSNDIQDQSPDLGTNPTWFWIYPDTTNVTTDTTIISANSFEQQFYNFRQQWTRTTNNNHHSNKKKKKNSNDRSNNRRRRRRRRRKNSISKSSNQKSRPTSNFSSVDSQFLRLVPAVPRGCHHPRQLEGRCPGEISVTILNHQFCYE